MKQTISDQQRILTPEFRVSFPHLFKPSGFKGTAPKYSVTMLFAKNSDLKSIKTAMRAAKIAEFGPNKDLWPTKIESPVVDGDDPKFADREGYKGHWAIKALSNEESKPGLVDQNVQPILEPSKFYPGCYARAYVFARVWEFGGKYGVQFILDHVQKTRDGKSFGGKKPADQVFTPIDFGPDESDFEDVEEMSF
jgi:hypothetical protein